MISSFNINDLEYFTPNEVSDPSNIIHILEDDSVSKVTLWKGGSVRAIACFQQMEKMDWAGFFLISKDFTARDGIRLRKHMYDWVDKYNVKRVWTATSRESCDDRWHRFMGMDIEKPIEIEGSECDIWSMTFEGRVST